MNLLQIYKRWKQQQEHHKLQWERRKLQWELVNLEKEIADIRLQAGRFHMTSEWTNEILLSGKLARIAVLKSKLGITNNVAVCDKG